MHPMAHGNPPTRNKPCLISSLSALVLGNLTKSPNFAVKASVTRRTTRLTVDLSKPKNVSPITWRNEPEAKNLRVIKTCISAETAWLRFVSGVISSAIRSTMYIIDSLPNRYLDRSSKSVYDCRGSSSRLKLLFFLGSWLFNILLRRRSNWRPAIFSEFIRRIKSYTTYLDLDNFIRWIAAG